MFPQLAYLQVHSPFVHCSDGPQVPQDPPHPLSPHSFPTQLGMHTQTPNWHSYWGPGQSPQFPPQPSSPQSFAAHCGVQHSPL